MIALLAAQAHAGAWTKEAGQLYAKAGADVYNAFRFVAPGAQEPTDANYFGQQYGVYAEAGVLPPWRAQLAVALPVVSGTVRTTVEDAFGTFDLRTTTTRTGDLRVAAQVALHPEAPVALSVDAKVPTYANGEVGGDYPNFQVLFPKPGDGQVDLGAMLFAGAALGGGAFGEAGVGYVHRTEAFVGWDTALKLTDGVRFSAKGGRSFGKFLPVIGVDGVISPDPSPVTKSFVSVSASALIDVADGVAIEPRVAGEVWARNASQGLGGGLGVSYRR